MIYTVLFIVLLVIVVIAFLLLTIGLCSLAVRCLKHQDTMKVISKLKWRTGVLAASCVLVVGLVFFTQLCAHTPVIKDENGKVVEGSIAELRLVNLNGREEWISIRGFDQKKPVILFLAGGPGGSQMAAVRYDLAELEKNFVVVNWDQPGSGKSYSAIHTKEMTPKIYVEDGYALTQYLCEEFHQDKIFLIGESWGSALGVFLVDKAPHLYYALVGTGQMVDFVETEKIDYDKAINIARENGDSEKIKKLEANGAPPYYGADVTWQSAEYLSYLNDSMAQNPSVQNGGYNTFRDLFASEYGVLDKINYLRGVAVTFNQVYQQLYDIDLRTDYAKIEVPIYFFLGRHDINAPISLAEEYFEILDAPQKAIIWFERSGHSPWINESDKFVQEFTAIAGSMMAQSN